MRMSQRLTYWDFCKDNGPVQRVRVPHDWAIAGPFAKENDNQITRILQDGETVETEHNGRTGGLPHPGHGEYTCRLDGPSAPGRCVFLEFDGAMGQCKVYVNENLAGVHNYGYGSFRVNATRFLHEGANTLRVTLDQPTDASRWYPGAGLYRFVRRVETAPVYVDYCGIHVKYLPAVQRLLVECNIENSTGKPLAGKIHLESPLFDTVDWDCSLSAGAYHFVRTLALKEHEKWDVTHPVLYPVMVRVSTDAFADESSVSCGIREFRFDPDKGFLLNGRPLKLNGVCMHHDLGPIGAAFNAAAAKRQLEIMRAMGCNAIRTSHNPPAPELLDLCDRMGFLVIDEAFDVWHKAKVKNDFSRFFDAEADLELAAMIRRDRNHPSIILWSIGNEVCELFHNDPDGPGIAKRLAAVVKEYDTERPVTAGMNCNHPGIAAELDVLGWNYQTANYIDLHHQYAGKAVYGSETMSAVSSRGIYRFPLEEYFDGDPVRREAPVPLQCAAFDVVNWGCSAETEYDANRTLDFIAGQFIWTGFDYLGEPAYFNKEWPARSSYFGCVDLVGLPKDRFYRMQSFWSDEPMVHIVPASWNLQHVKGPFSIFVYTNGDSAELFLNGKSLGKRSPKSKSESLMRRYSCVWDGITWEPGELKVIAFKSDQEWAEETLRTAGPAAKLILSAERTVCRADGDDMLFITVAATDENGTVCPDAGNFVRFHLEGDPDILTIAAADAGNAASVEIFPLPECSLFSGKAVVYLRSAGKAGTVRLTAESEGLASCRLTLQTE